MIKNTEAFYEKAKEFQNKRAEMVSEYEDRLKSLEGYAGSPRYEKEVDALTKEHTEALTELRDQTRQSLLIILRGMEEAIQKRKINPPTNEQLNLIHLLKMREKVSEEELDRAAEMVKDNAVAIGVIQEIAHDNEIMKGYTSMCSEMSSQTAMKTVGDIREGLEDWLQYDTSKGGRMANSYYGEHYGTPAMNLRKRPLFSNYEECFEELSPLSPATLKMFSDVVDG